MPSSCISKKKLTDDASVNDLEIIVGGNKEYSVVKIKLLKLVQ